MKLIREHASMLAFNTLVVICFATATGIAQQVKTQKTGDIEIPATGVNCSNGETRACAPADCVQCRDLVVNLPLTAQVKAVRYYSTAGGDGGDVAIREIAPGMSPTWSDMKAVQQSSTSTNTVVTSQFRNWQASRARRARLEVDYTE